MKLFKIILSNIIIFIILFGILEVSSRLIFPEFKGHIFSNTKSMNINYIDGDLRNNKYFTHTGAHVGKVKKIQELQNQR